MIMTLPYAMVASFVTALVAMFLVMPVMITTMRRIYSKGQPIRDDGPQTHRHTKKGTPTMGGAIIVMTSLLSAIIWGDVSNPFLLIALFMYLSYAAIGIWDDWRKLSRQHHQGIRGKWKLLLQMAITLVAYYWLSHFMPPDMLHTLYVPVWHVMIPCGYLYIPFMMVVVIGSANSVNLTDGLDGLVTGPSLFALGAFGMIVYMVGGASAEESELLVIIAAVMGALIGFLWFNAPPACIFMGDTGSLAIGGLLGIIAVMMKQELLLAIIGLLFVIEALSVILQVGYFKWTKGRRIFKMAPIHHHFEQLGWPETRVVFRFWIVAFLCATLGIGLFLL